MFPLKRMRLRSDERGSALMAVLGVMAVTAIIGMTITAATINALGVTSSTKASVQALAAAEAGVDVAVSALRTTNGCSTNADGSLTFTPVAGVLIKEILIVPDNMPTGETGACPDADTTSVRITSTGTATSSGVAGANSGDTSTVEVTYSYDDIVVQVPLAGVAVYAYKVDGVLKKFVLSSADNSVATSVMIKTGDVECTNGASIGGDLVLGEGSATLDMCDVAGSVHVSDDASINKSTIGGDVRARGVATITNSTVGGAISSGPAVPAPVVPGWVDIDFDPAQWVAQGYNVVDWAGSCAIDKNNVAWTNLKNYTQPTVVNFLTKCPTTAVTTSNSMDTVTLNTNLVFFAHEFTFDKLYFATTATRTLSFIVPDGTPDGTPTCAPPSGLSGEIWLTNEADFGDTVSAMIYTPCRVYSDRNGFRGQIYGGEIEFGQQAQLTFVPVGVAGVDLAAGVTVPTVTGAELGGFVSRRELAGVG